MSDSPEALFASFLAAVGADPSDDRLVGTPAAYTELLREFTRERNAPVFSRFENPGETDRVILQGIAFHSLCEHHLVPFFGTVDIAYDPDQWIAGLGGFDRLVAHQARQLQLQERMTHQIANAIAEQLAPRGVLVRITARQMCVELRGGTTGLQVSSVSRNGTLCSVEAAMLFPIPSSPPGE